MKYINIFLASSVEEFEAERRKLGDFIRRLNDIYVTRNIYFRLIVCEDLSNAVAKERKQQEYNEQIRNSQYFYVLFGRKAGEYTLEEFEVALEQFRMSGAPLIYTYFLELPVGEQAEQSVLDFMERLDWELGHYYNIFSHLDTIKLDMLLEMSSNPELNSQMKFEDGWAVLDGQQVVPLENIPMYSKNEALQGLIAEQSRLNEEFAELMELHNKKTNDTEICERMREAEKRRKQITETLHKIEMGMLELRRQVSQKRQSGKKLNWREEKALELINRGEYEAAKDILRDVLWEKELEQAEEIVESAKEPIREYISGKRTLISTMTFTYFGYMKFNWNKREEIETVYKKICSLAEKHSVEMDVLYDYSMFLTQATRYEEGMAVAQKLYSYYQKSSGVSEEDMAKLLSLLGNLYKVNKEYAEAARFYEKSVKVKKEMAIKNPRVHEAELAKDYDDLADLMETIKEYAKARSFLREAIKTYHSLEKWEPRKYEVHLQVCCQRLERLLRNTGEYEEAEKLKKEADSITERMTEGLDVKALSKVDIVQGFYDSYADYAKVMREYGSLEALAVTTSAYAALTEKRSRQAAANLYEEALKLYRELAESNSKAYEPDLAKVCHEYANLLTEMKEYERAEELYEEALIIRRRLMGKDPEVYEGEVANTCHWFARMLHGIGEYKKARKLYEEALIIHRKLAEKNPEAYIIDLAFSCNSLARLLADMEEYERTIELFEEGLVIFNRLTEKNPERYEPVLVSFSNDMITLLKMIGGFHKVKTTYREVLALYKRLEEADAQKYASSYENLCDKLIDLVGSIKKYNEVEELQEKLEIYQCLAAVKPEIYEPEWAECCHNLGYAMKKANRQEEAGKLYGEALNIRRRLYEIAPETYAPKLVISYRRMAEWLYDAGEQDKFWDTSQEMLKIRRSLAVSNPEKYAFVLANECSEVAFLMKKAGEYKRAEALYAEALEIRRHLEEKNPEMYRAELAESCGSLGEILYELKENGKAKKLCREAIALYKSQSGKEQEVKRMQKLLKTHIVWRKLI